MNSHNLSINNHMYNFKNQHQNVHNLLDKYYRIVVQANRKLNLVSRRDVENLFLRLIDESLYPLSWDLCRMKSPLIDIGTGSGIPGIPLFIANPGLTGVLLDAHRRKSLFLRRTVELLGLEGIDVVCARVEDICDDEAFSHKFNLLVTRAVAPIERLLEWGSSLLDSNGELIAWKGSSLDKELEGFDLSGWSGPERMVCTGDLTLVRFEKK